MSRFALPHQLVGLLVITLPSLKYENARWKCRQLPKQILESLFSNCYLCLLLKKFIKSLTVFFRTSTPNLCFFLIKIHIKIFLRLFLRDFESLCPDDVQTMHISGAIRTVFCSLLHWMYVCVSVLYVSCPPGLEDLSLDWRVISEYCIMLKVLVLL